MSDLYNILEVDRNATQNEIKKAYRRLSKKYHPDVNRESDAESKFKDISNAYEVLSDPNKKSNYDNYGSSNGNPFNGSGHGFSAEDIFSQFGDIFGNRGGGQRRKRQSRGSDLRMKVVLNIDEILKGATKKLKYKRQVKCDPCNGSGGSDIVDCLVCNGSGERIVTQNTIFGQVRTQAPCTDCNGQGKQIKNKCTSCRGDGTLLKEQIVDVEIPVGVSTGMQLNMQGFGNDIRGGIPGDLYIIVEEEQNFSFKRENNNIIVDKTISVIDAICGSNIKVSTPHGDVPVYIEPGTEHGKTIRISGKGIPDIHYGLGDLFIKISIRIPKNIELDEKFLLEKLKESKNFQV